MFASSICTIFLKAYPWSKMRYACKGNVLNSIENKEK
jgi:hypothetical protein